MSLDLMSSLNELIEDDRAEGPEVPMFSEAERERLRRLLDSIAPREARILTLRYGLDDDRPMTLAQIGRKVKLTRERVRQIERDALRRLRTILETREHHEK